MIKITKEGGEGFTAFARFLDKVNAEVEVGWSEEWTDEDTVMIAKINTLGGMRDGAAHPPKRNALTPATKDNRRARNKAIGRALKAIRANPAAREKIIAAITKQEADWLREAVLQLSSPPNADSTIDRKGFDNPLVGPGADGGRIVAGVGSSYKIK